MSVRFLPSEITLTVIKSGFIHVSVVVTIDGSDEQSGRNILQFPILKMVQEVYTHRCSGDSEAKRFSVTVVEAKENFSGLLN